MTYKSMGWVWAIVLGLALPAAATTYTWTNSTPGNTQLNLRWRVTRTGGGGTGRPQMQGSWAQPLPRRYDVRVDRSASIPQTWGQAV